MCGSKKKGMDTTNWAKCQITSREPQPLNYKDRSKNMLGTRRCHTLSLIVYISSIVPYSSKRFGAEREDIVYTAPCCILTKPDGAVVPAKWPNINKNYPGMCQMWGIYYCAISVYKVLLSYTYVGRAGKFICMCPYMCVIYLLMIMLIFPRSTRHTEYLFFVFEHEKIDQLLSKANTGGRVYLTIERYRERQKALISILYFECRV